MSCVATSGVATALPRVSLSRALLTQCHVDLCATLQRLLRPSRNATWRFFNRRKWRFASPDRENARGAFGANAESPRLTLSSWRVRGKDVSGLLPFLGEKKKGAVSPVLFGAQAQPQELRHEEGATWPAGKRRQALNSFAFLHFQTQVAMAPDGLSKSKRPSSSAASSRTVLLAKPLQFGRVAYFGGSDHQTARP